ncbi:MULTISPECIES: extracellular solute-binding protein [Saccharothrix]|uniref:extracellular solute-binding protein n=1 Tax=Saccharothrix TaxID=2071 RepID=UPI001300CC2B|nr:extracellular solute-binding protein [Saccharothrix sp. CB00851]
MLAAVVLLLTACTSPVEDEATEGVGPITFVDGVDTSSDRQVERVVAEWNARHSLLQEVTFKEMSPATDIHRAQLMARSQDLAGVPDPSAHAAQCYDVMNMDVVWTAAFAAGGYLEPLDPAEFDVDSMHDEAVRTARYDGRLWAVPWRVDAGLLYYRADLLAAEDEQPPRTWPDLERLASELGPKYGIAGYVGQFANHEGVVVNAMEAIWAHNGDPLHPDTPDAEAGVRALADGFADGWIPQAAFEYREEESRRAFQDGNAVFMRNWPYVRPWLDRPESNVRGSKWGAVPLPGPSALGGWNLAVSRCSVHQQTAREFIRFLTGADTQLALFRLAGWAPSLKALYREPELELLGEAVLTARTRPTSAYYDELASVMRVLLRHALANPDSVETMMRTLADRVREAEDGR